MKIEVKTSAACVHRRTGGLEMGCWLGKRLQTVHRRTGGLEMSVLCEIVAF